jgi:hypothetical protein
MAAQFSGVDWIHGAADCGANADRLLQVYQFDANTFIIRENKSMRPRGDPAHGRVRLD